MELFSFVETFFFISLAITFILIMMLIYHFRERLTIIEKKTSTMFDIITNVVNELNFVRNNLVLKNTSSNVENPPSNVFSHSIQPSSFSNKIVVSDNESESDSESDSDSDSIYSENFENSDENEKIKIINIDLHSNKEEKEEEQENIELEELNSLSEDDEIYNSVTDFEAYSNMENTNNEPTKDTDESCIMKIEKINKLSREDLNQTYRKMDIQSLRTLVLAKGISNDVKKLKKIELIELLLSNSNM